MIPIKISIITACFNMEKYIEKTILSVLNQGYENLEYIIVDGGSTDGTLNIINKYKNQISHIISEKDNGMYDAIHKGILKSSGDIIAWLNADDQYFPWTLKKVNDIFTQFKQIDWLCGQSAFSNEKGELTRIFTHPGSKPAKFIENGWFREGVLGFLQQENMFWKREIYFKAGGKNLNYKYAGDFELWTKFAKSTELVSVSIPLAMFMRRNDGLSMGSRGLYINELEIICKEKEKYPNFLWYLLPKKAIFIRMLRYLTIRKSKLISLDFVTDKMKCKNICRSVSGNTLSEMIYMFL